MAAPVAGVILAGGRSSRMGGADKSLQLFAGRPMIAHVAASLGPQVDRLIVNANGDPRRFGFLDLPVVGDTIAGFAGPLAGILAGLEWANANGCTRIVTAATDTPFFPRDLVRRLSQGAADAEAIAVARCEGRVHPVFALWPTSVRDAIEAFLHSEQKASVLKFVEARPHLFVDFDPMAIRHGKLDPFFNINTPADLEEAQRLAEEIGR